MYNLFVTPEQGSAKTESAARMLQERCPTQAADTILTELLMRHALVAKLPHEPVGVPYEAKVTFRMTIFVGQEILAVEFSVALPQTVDVLRPSPGSTKIATSVRK